MANLAQSPWLGMVALGDNTTADPNNRGNHLRWAFDPRLGFPPGGFDLYRRLHFTASPTCITLEGYTSNQNLGKRTTVGDLLLESATDIRTVELVAAGGAPEIDLRNRPSLSIWPREFCHRVRVYLVDFNPAGGSIQATAYDREVPVSSDKTIASTGIQYLDLAADRIERVVLRGADGQMNGVLTQICYVTVTADATSPSSGWIRLNQKRICLPLNDPNYPAACRLPPQTNEWQSASARIPNAVWSRYAPKFTDLRNTLARIYDPTADPRLTTKDVPCPPASGNEGTPKFVHDPLGVVLLTTLDPYIARMVGLYWIDGAFYVAQGLQGPAPAEVGTAYDYMVVAHYPDAVRNADVSDTWDADAVGTIIDGKVPHGPFTYATSAALSVVARQIADFQTARALSIPNNLGHPLRITLLEPAQRVELYIDVPDANARAFARAYSKGVVVDTAMRQAAVNGPITLSLQAAAIDSVELEGRNLHLAKTDYHVSYLPGGNLAYVVYNVVLGVPPALPAPSRLEGTPLPVLTHLGRDCQPVSGQMAAGLRWDRNLAGNAILPRGPILYDIQRQGLGNGDAPAPIAPNAWATAKLNVLVARAPPDSRCEPFEPLPGWSAGRPDYIDAPPSPQQRWYAYRVRGKDIFGRVSAPRELKDVGLADVVPPPPPADVHAKYLDPDDPNLAPDERAWTHPNGGARHGLRVGWRWTDNLHKQAPDCAQFRVYLKTGRLNVVLGNLTAVGAPDASGNVQLTTDLVATHLPAGDIANAFQAEWLSQGVNLYQVVASGSAGGSLTLTFKRIEWIPRVQERRRIEYPELQPIPNPGAFSLSVRPPKPLAGMITEIGWPDEFGTRIIVDTDVRYIGAVDSLAGKKLRQAGRLWEISGNTTGWKFQISLRVRACEPNAPSRGESFHVVAADRVTPLLLDAGNPHWRDYRDPLQWEQRLHLEPRRKEPTGRVTARVDHGDGTSTLTTDQTLTDASNRYLGGELQVGEHTWPVIGHTTGANFQVTVLNNRRYRGTGLVEQIVEQIALPPNVDFTYWPDIVIPITPLAIPPGQPATYAVVGVSAADDKKYRPDPRPHGGQPGNEGRVSPPQVIVRLDRTAPPACDINTDVLMATPGDFLGHSVFKVRWRKIGNSPGLRYQVYRTLAEPGGSEPRQELWRQRYRLLTHEPLHPDDPAYQDVAEPGHASVNPNLMAYRDTLDGKSSSRYYYRVRTVNAAGTRSEWSPVIGPVACPDVVPPRAPVITKVLGGDRQITLRWAPNREPDLHEYRVYRADSKEAAEDVRLMMLVHTEAEARAPEARPAEMRWTDRLVPETELVTSYYRLVAVDESGNLSPPSPPVGGRTYDDSRPASPLWGTANLGPEGLQLIWTLADPSHRPLVQRRDLLVYPSRWDNLSTWLSAGTEQIVDSTRQDGRTYRYRVRVKDNRGRTNRDFTELEA